jgi:hypothetical protein
MFYILKQYFLDKSYFFFEGPLQHRILHRLRSLLQECINSSRKPVWDASEILLASARCNAFIKSPLQHITSTLLYGSMPIPPIRVLTTIIVFFPTVQTQFKQHNGQYLYRITLAYTHYIIIVLVSEMQHLGSSQFNFQTQCTPWECKWNPYSVGAFHGNFPQVANINNQRNSTTLQVSVAMLRIGVAMEMLLHSLPAETETCRIVLLRWLLMFATCGRFPWKAPTTACRQLTHYILIYIYKNGCVCVCVFVCSGITLERLERYRPNLVHIWLYVCVRISCMFYIYIYFIS